MFAFQGGAPNIEVNVTSSEEFSMEFEAEDKFEDEGLGGTSSSASGPSHARATSTRSLND